MSSIFDLYSEGYHHAVSLNLQQKGSKLSTCVRQEIQTTDRFFYDQIGPTEAVDISEHHADTPLIDTSFDRRMVVLSSSDWADLIDRESQLHIVQDPTSAYALNAAYALGRKKDEKIIKAALGDAFCGNNGETLQPLPESQTIAVDYSEDGSNTASGLTIEKLRMARQMLDDAEVDDDEEQFCIVTAKQINDLLRTTEITSDDYNTVKALVDGKINTFMGFKFKRISSKLLPLNSVGEEDNKVNQRSVICFAKSGLLLATADDIQTDISYRKDKRMAIQVYASLSCGATRMNESKVVQILAKE